MRKNISQDKYAQLPFYKKPFYRVYYHFVSIDDAYHKRPKKWIYNLVFFSILIGLLLYFSLDIGFFDSFRNPNFEKLGKMLQSLVQPNLDYFFGLGAYSGFQNSVIYQIIETFAIAFVGTILASVISIPFGFLASRRMIGKWGIISEIILILIRTFPEILLGFILVKVVGFGPLAGVAVLSIHSVGMIGKMYAEQLDVIQNEPLEALDACGASFAVKVKLGVVPQIAPNFLSVVLYRFDLNIRTASLLGIVGAGGIGYPIFAFGQNQHWPELASVLYGVIILVLFVDFISAQIRKKLI